MDLEVRKQVLRDAGASDTTAEELLTYNENVFNHDALEQLTLPLPPEPHLAAWEIYAAADNAFEELQQRLVQLRFPVREGISATDPYRAATRKGVFPEEAELSLNHPEQVQVIIHESAAGRVPVIVAQDRNDFVTLVQALVKRGEPVPIPDSMGATMVGGFNNWDRIRTYREEWSEKNDPALWQAEFRRLIPQKERYQDRFMILSASPYSGIAAESVGLSEEKWREASIQIRREHECAHYFTRRILQSMKNKLLDELIADYMGITAAAGRFASDWFLRFLGLEDYPSYRASGRLGNYKGDPALTDDAFTVLQTLAKNAAENVASCHDAHAEELGNAFARCRMLLALSKLTIEEIAASDGEDRLAAALSWARGRVD